VIDRSACRTSLKVRDPVFRRASSRAVACAAVALHAASIAHGAQPAPPSAPPPQEAEPLASESPFEFRPIRSIRAEGLQRVDEQLIFNQIRSREGQPYRDATAKEDVRRLFRIGQFRTLDAIVEPNDDGSVDLIFRVEEAPIVQDVQVVGNRSIPDADLANAVRIDPGVPIDEYELGRAERAIEELYRRRGFFLVDVTVDREELERDGVVLFRIREGGRVRVTDIRFEGNDAFAPREIRTSINTKVRGIFNRGPLDNEVLDADVAAIVRFYRDRGYLDVRADRRITPSPDGREAIVTFVIDEGPLYTLRGVIIRNPDLAEGQLPSVSTEQAVALMTVKPGDVYSLIQIQRSIDAVRDAYWTLGHPDVQVSAQELRVPAERPEVDLVLTVNEGPRVLVGEVIIQGNGITKQRVIRRELQQADIRPERPLDRGALNRAERRLNSLRLFDPVEQSRIVVQSDDPARPTYRDVLTEVKETDTGSVTFLAAVGSDSGLIGSISIGQRNFDIARTPESLDELLSNRAFRGAGQDFNLTLAPGTDVQTYSVSLTEPWLFDQPISLGGTLFLRDREYDQYDESRYGGRARLGRRFGDLWTAAVNLRAESIELSDIDEDAPVDFFEVADRSLLTGLGVSLTRTTVPFEERFTPSRGTRLELSAEQVGALGGDFDFTKLEAEHILWLPIMEDYLGRRTVLSFKTRVGYIPQSGEAPTYERFYLGGRNFRGFEFRTISPRSVQQNGDPSDEPVGGEWLFFFGIELEQPIWQNMLSGVLFLDTGTVTNDPGLDDYRSSAGFGFRLRIPALSNAPLAFDFGFPIQKQTGDEERLFSFSIDLPF
jgi:outer membrane protein insertion porin family